MADQCGKPCNGSHCMNPNNGEILGMATSNTFDLNNPRNTDGYTEDELLALGKKEAVGVYRRENPDQTITEDQVLDHYSREEVISYGKQVAWNQAVAKLLCQRYL